MKISGQIGWFIENYACSSDQRFWKGLKWAPALMKLELMPFAMASSTANFKAWKKLIQQKKCWVLYIVLGVEWTAYVQRRPYGRLSQQFSIAAMWSESCTGLWVLFMWPVKCTVYLWQSKAFLSWLVHLGCARKLNYVLSCSSRNKGWHS